MNKKVVRWLTGFLLLCIASTYGAASALAQEHGRAVGNRMAVSEQNSRESFQARTLGKPEDIQGRLDSLEGKTLVLINSEGIPYVFVLDEKTEIIINGSKGNAALLAAQMHQNASVRFVPRADGNIALSIDVNHW